MPVFNIDAPNGDVYEIEAPEGATKEQAFEFFKREHSAGRIKPKKSKLLNNPLTGAGETGISMLTGSLAQPISGIAGLLSGGNADVVRDVQEALTYSPKGETGKRYTENVGKVFSMPIEWVGRKAYDVTGSEAARSIAEAGTEIGLNFLPLGAAAKGAKKVFRKSELPITPAKDLSSIERSIDIAKGKEVETPLPETIYTDSTGVARSTLPDAGELASRRAMEKARQEALAKKVEEVRPTQEAFNRLTDEELQAYKESLIKDGPVEKQMHLPFEAGPEEIAFRRAQHEPQMDMFAEDIVRNPQEYTPQRTVEPNPQMDLLPPESMLERRWQDVPQGPDKQAQMEQMFHDREQQQKLDSLEESTKAQEESLMRLEERLREEAYIPPTREELRAERGRPTKPGFRGRRSQSGALDIQAISEGFQKIFRLNKTSPEVVAAKQQLQKQAKADKVNEILGATSGYVENIRSPEQVIAAAETAKDIPMSAVRGMQTVTPGINVLAIKHSNPLVKFTRFLTRSVFVEGNRLTEKYITGQDGIGKVVRGMSKKEQAEAVALLQLGDKKQFKITEDLMRQHGFSEKQIEFVNKFYEMDKFKLDLWNQKLTEAGMPTVEERVGHVPGIFRGDYKQLVLDKDNKPLGFIGVDTKWQLKKAQEAMKKEFPSAKFSPVQRSKLGGSAARGHEFSQMQEVLDMLAEHDPSYKEVQDLIKSTITSEADKAYGAAYHAMKKKGIVGSEGNRSWVTAEQNAHDFIKSYLQHWEDQVISHLNLPVERDLRALMQNPELKNSENAKLAVDHYIKNMTGRNVGEVGGALNTILDTPGRLVGIGPSYTREFVNQFNKRFGQWHMGFGNVLFSLTQLLQVPQMALPELQSMAKQLKIPMGDVTSSFGTAMKQMFQHYLGKEDVISAEVFKEARDRGLLTFSEFSDVNKITQGKKAAAFDKYVDFNRNELGERPTRPLVFLAAVDLLKRQGLEGKVLYDSAYNATQAAMIDYAPHERPAMYGRMGVAGQLAGGLQTFKHGYYNQLNRFIGEAGKGNVAPLMSAGVLLLAYAGLKGLPGYDEANSIVEWATQKYGGKRQNIAELIMKQLPEWSKSGVLSDVTDINLQGRLSAANALPDSPLEAVSPWVSAGSRKFSALADVASYQDALSLKNLGVAVTPEGPLKGLAERALLTDEEGFILDKKGLRGNERSEWDKNVRLFTGGRSLTEALQSEKQWMGGKRRQGYKETQKSIMEDLQRKYVQGTLTQADTQEAAKKYSEAQGDPKKLISQMIEFAKTTKMSKQERLQGIPTGSLSSLYRYQEFNE